MAKLDSVEDCFQNGRNNCIMLSDCEKLIQVKVEDEENKISELTTDNRGLASPLASEESTQISLQYIREHRDGLNKHRLSLLNRVPEQKTFASYKVNSVQDKDLAYLSAATGDEFALLRGKNEDILYHGTHYNCDVDKEELLMDLLKNHKVRLEAHTHPDYDKIIPSVEDRNFLNEIGQKYSKIISSYTGKVITFSSNRFGND